MKTLLALPILFLAMPSFRAQAAPRYALAVSSQANHSASSFLGSASVLTGNVYVFTSLASVINVNPTGIAHVCYWLDRAAMGTSDHCEAATPYDLKGSFTCATGGDYAAGHGTRVFCQTVGIR